MISFSDTRDILNPFLGLSNDKLEQFKKLDLSIDSKLFFPCPNCPKMYKGKYTLSRHLRLECGKTATNKCHVCGQSFKHKHRLISHMKSIHSSQYLTNLSAVAMR